MTEYIVKAELPGLNKENIKVSVASAAEVVLGCAVESVAS
jgi:HSP20 family molecular chaperone IbpA